MLFCGSDSGASRQHQVGQSAKHDSGNAAEFPVPLAASPPDHVLQPSLVVRTVRKRELGFVLEFAFELQLRGYLESQRESLCEAVSPCAPPSSKKNQNLRTIKEGIQYSRAGITLVLLNIRSHFYRFNTVLSQQQSRGT
jgi:hypothetical protein